MAPLPTVNVSLVASPSSAALESTLTTTVASLPLPVVITFLVLICLYILIPRIFNWRYPCQSIIPLLVLCQDIERLIFENTRTVIINDGVRARNHELELLMRRLKTIHTRVKALKAKNRAEPPRSSVLAWAVFRWTMIKEIDTCYIALTALDMDVQVVLERSGGVSNVSRGSGQSRRRRV